MRKTPSANAMQGRNNHFLKRVSGYIVPTPTEDEGRCVREGSKLCVGVGRLVTQILIGQVAWLGLTELGFVLRV